MQSFSDHGDGKPKELTVSEFADHVEKEITTWRVDPSEIETLEYSETLDGVEVFFMNGIYRMTMHEFESLVIRTKDTVNWVEETTPESNEEVIEALNHMGEREYQTYDSWKRACRIAYPGCTFRGDKDIGGAVLNGRDVGEWGGDVGSVFVSKPKPSDVVDSLFDE